MTATTRTRTAPPLTPSTRGVPAYTQTLPCTAESVASARLSIRNTLTCWGLDALVGDAELIASELATNAVRHTRRSSPEGPGHYRLTIERLCPHTVRLWVFGGSRDKPHPGKAADGAESGRGLTVVAFLADRWGIELRRSGKGIWAELDVHAVP
ncbi:ATP-binding protein [Streptomyces sp. NPDC001843]|uniref:ATP-binding protein n=1 Tax=Streptomyces sp. NPDC001843 TaxID=3364617 RepID=UPI003689F427